MPSSRRSPTKTVWDCSRCGAKNVHPNRACDCGMQRQDYIRHRLDYVYDHTTTEPYHHHMPARERVWKCNACNQRDIKMYEVCVICGTTFAGAAPNVHSYFALASVQQANPRPFTPPGEMILYWKCCRCGNIQPYAEPNEDGQYPCQRRGRRRRPGGYIVVTRCPHSACTDGCRYLVA
jgi:hypothetical protein